MSSLRPTRKRTLPWQAGLILLSVLINAALALAAVTGASSPKPSFPGASYKQEMARSACRKLEKFCSYPVDIAPRLCLSVSNLGNHNT
jgi:hypothetical protein